MDFLKYHNKIVISPLERKKELLEFRKQNPNINFKWFDKESFCQKVLGSIDEEALIYLHRKGYNYKNAKELLRYVTFAKKGISSKIDDLSILYQELTNENLLHVNDVFLSYIKKQSFIVIGYLKDDKELNFIKDKYHLDMNFIEETYTLSNEVYNFEFFNDEIRYIFEQIGGLLTSNIEPSKIKLIIRDEKYLKEIKKYSNFYNIPFNFPSEITYDKTEDFKELLDYLKTTIAIEAFNFFKDKSYYQKAFKKLFEKYMIVKDYINEDEVVEYLKEKASSIKIESIKYKNGISICDFKDCQKDDYVFVLGFCLGSFPSISKDTDYLSDKEKEQLFISTSFDNQNLQTQNIHFFLNKFSNVKISFSKKKGKEVSYISKIIEKNNMELLDYKFSSIIYSSKHFAYFMAKVFDNYHNFSFESEYLTSCNKEDINYKTYDHRFKNFDYYNDKEINIAFTSMKEYIECPFKYYLKKVLNADSFESTVNIKIGNIFHHLLEKKFKGLTYSIKDEMKKEDLTPREEVLVETLIPQMEFVLQRMDSWEKDCKYTSFEAESDIFSYRLDEKTSVYGKIDLICKDNNNYSIIDFKTSDFKFVPEEVKLGFSLQLPIYYLITSSDTSLLKDHQIKGLYILNVLNKDFNGGDRNYLKFNGITLDEIGYELMNGSNGEYLKKPRKKDDLVFSKDYFDELRDEVVEISKKAVLGIRNGDFKIQPVIINSKNRSCDKCPFYDVCYHDYHDNLYLKKEGKE